IGATPSGRWHSWQLLWRMGAMSLQNVNRFSSLPEPALADQPWWRMQMRIRITIPVKNPGIFTTDLLWHESSPAQKGVAGGSGIPDSLREIRWFQAAGVFWALFGMVRLSGPERNRPDFSEFGC